MPELKWLELARTDLLAIVDYISDDNPDAAQRIMQVQAIQEGLQEIDQGDVIDLGNAKKDLGLLD